MIFIGGVQARTTRLRKLTQGCPYCGHFELYEKRNDQYLSLFFIPLFPIQRGHVFTSCDHCGAASGHGDYTGPDVDSSRFIRCRSCGQEVEKDYRYCPYCGKKA